MNDINITDSKQHFCTKWKIDSASQYFNNKNDNRKKKHKICAAVFYATQAENLFFSPANCAADASKKSPTEFGIFK